MHELGLDPAEAALWFSWNQNEPFAIVSLDPSVASSWPEEIGTAVRRCYVADDHIEERIRRTGMSWGDLLGAKLPDPGSTMAGDFGEILAYFFLAGTQHPTQSIGPKKWRLKQDRTKAAPFSDVIQFVLPEWPTASPQDELICAEVKTKATNSSGSPIGNAIEDCDKDRTTRLGKTLVWLRERAMFEELGAVTIDHLNRFINAIDHPQHSKQFYAIAVICSTLLADELVSAPSLASPDYDLVVISVPNLRDAYMALFAKVTISQRGRDLNGGIGS